MENFKELGIKFSEYTNLLNKRSYVIKKKIHITLCHNINPSLPNFHSISHHLYYLQFLHLSIQLFYF